MKTIRFWAPSLREIAQGGSNSPSLTYARTDWFRTGCLLPCIW